MSKTLTQLQGELDRLYQLNSREEMEAFFMNEILDHVPGCCSVSDEYILLMNEAGSYYRGTSQYKKAASYFQGLASTMERFQLEHTIGYATVFNNLAGCYRMAGAIEEAESIFQQAIALYEAAGAQDTMEYASALNNLSICYQASCQWEQALKYQRRALSCIEAIPGQSETLAASLTNYASLCYAAGLKDDAWTSIGKAITCLEESGHTHSSTYIGALHVRAYLYSQTGQLDRALAEYETVLKLAEKLFGRNSDYSAASKNAAIICHRLGKLRQAVDYLSESLCIDRQIFPPGHPRIADSEQLLATYQREVISP